MLRNKKALIALSLIPQIILIKVLVFFPDFVESYYSNGLYLFISKLLRYIFGWIPFSFGDVFYTVAVLMTIRWLFKNRRRIRKDTKNWLIDIFATVSILYFAFHLFWAFNYYRLPVHKALDIDNNYSTEQLLKVTKSLIEISNSKHHSITKNDSIKIDMPYTKEEMINLTKNGYTNLSEKYPHLNPNPTSTKTSIYSSPLTYMGFSGYLNPFTNEAQVDGLIPLYKFPTTIAHEQAHQIGYAAENETNFIGCLATIHNDDKYFKYSGYIFALRHCLNEVYRRDETIYKTLLEEINPGILANYQESYDFWMSYQNPLEPIFKNLYGNFLKANSQEKGIESYSYAVALFVNYFDN